MFGRVKFGTINASQLFFQGSHVFSIFSSFFSISGYMPATKIKSLHSTAGSENIWQFCCQNLFHTIQRSQFQRQMWDQAQNHFKETKPVNTLRPRNSFCCLLVSSHFFYPNFKRPIPSQKWILKQQAPLNIPKIPKAQHENQLAHVRTPSVTSSEPLPKRLENPSGATAGFAGNRVPPWPPQRSAARPRRHGRSEPPRCSGVWPRAPRMRRRRRGSCGCRRETRR